MTLPLKSLSSNGGKEPYTEAEKNLAHICVSQALIFAEVDVPKPKLDPIVENLLNEIKDEHKSVDTLCRDLFRSMVRSINGSGKEFKGTSSFPKERDPTSIQLLMRVGLERSGRSDLKDEVFHRYGGKKAC